MDMGCNMTTTDLVDALAEFVREATQDMVLPAKVKKGEPEPKARPPHIYKMRVPSKEDERQQIPYIIVQHLKGKDEMNEHGEMDCTAVMRIIVATYSENQSDGAMCVENILTRIRIALLKRRMVAKKFLLNMPLEYVVYPDSTAPYYLGEMITNWQMPAIKREVSYD